ncbi:MAG: PRC-barrel domain-containing protein [Ardenticatenaceae bacterium]|nr:PRC-barrel domain-containing protein [Ardenticatenaceae bacterium]
MILATMKELNGFELQAKDGKLGKIEELYFDEETWAVRYLVVNVGNWLLRDYVLLSPTSVEDVDREAEVVRVALTKDQIENSPDINTHKPISREKEERLHAYFNWPPYWRAMPMVAAGAAPHGAPVAPIAPYDLAPEEEKEMAAKGIQSSLRSTKEVSGYDVFANDGELGHVETFLVDTLRWIVRYVVVDTGTWLPGRKVLIAPMWVSGIRWADSEMYLKLTQREVETSPEYDPEQHLYRDYETRLYDHYGQLPYWEE